MSSPTVRTAILTRIRALVSPIEVFDLDDYLQPDDLPATGQCLLVDFAAASDEIASIGGEDSLGFEEFGTVEISWLYETGFSTTSVLTAAEALRVDLRGHRLSDALIIESVDPFMGVRSPLYEHSRWSAFTAFLNYSLHTCR